METIKRLFFILFCVGAVGYFAFTSRGFGQTALDDQAKVLNDLQTINQKEIAAGQLAQKNGTVEAVKSYGKRLADDHRDLNAKILQYAKDHKIDLPFVVAPSVANLETAKGSDFNQKFLSEMIQGHEDTIKMVEAARDGSSDGQFKTFLNSVIPDLKRHQAQAQKLERKIGNG
jgi:putative membrane protein